MTAYFLEEFEVNDGRRPPLQDFCDSLTWCTPLLKACENLGPWERRAEDCGPTFVGLKFADPLSLSFPVPEPSTQPQHSAALICDEGQRPRQHAHVQPLEQGPLPRIGFAPDHGYGAHALQ